MTPYRHLLCPVDFSEMSRRALEWSLGLREEFSSELTILHVVDTELLAVGNLVAIPDAASELARRAREQFKAWSEELDVSKAQFTILEGAPAETILKATEDMDVGLLVMGTHGLTGFQRLLIGSVTEKVLHRVQVPLLTFSPRVSTQPGFVPKTILMAVDFGPESEHLVRHGVWLKEHFGAKLLVVYVVPVPYVVLNDRTLEQLTPSQVEKLQGSLGEEYREELQKLLPESAGADVEILTPVGAPFQTLAALVEARNVDLVVMGAGGHGESELRWLGSTCHKIVRSGPAPVLIVR